MKTEFKTRLESALKRWNTFCQLAAESVDELHSELHELAQRREDTKAAFTLGKCKLRVWLHYKQVSSLDESRNGGPYPIAENGKPSGGTEFNPVFAGEKPGGSFFPLSLKKTESLPMDKDEIKFALFTAVKKAVENAD